MKAKYALFLFFAGVVVGMVGVLVTILHWPGAHAWLTAGLMLEAAGILAFLYKLFANAKVKAFLNT